MNEYILLRLQLLADGEGEGGDPGETGGAAAPQGGDNDPSPAGEQSAEDIEKEFDALIKGKYKDVYGKRVGDTVKNRLKGSSETIARYQGLDPALSILSSRYGTAEGDYAALAAAIQADDDLLESEAMEKGLTVPQLREFKKLQSDNARMRAASEARERQNRADEIYNGWMQQAEAVKQTFPGFDFEAELENNKDFLDLLRSGVSVEAAYKVCHMDDVVTAAMQRTAQETKNQMTNAIAAGQRRPNENGVNPHAPASTTIDVSKLTDAQYDEYVERARRGERITFRN